VIETTEVIATRAISAEKMRVFMAVIFPGRCAGVK
jgi:hypothetical protein